MQLESPFSHATQSNDDVRRLAAMPLRAIRPSIVFPTYKERVRLPRTLLEMTDYLLATFDDFEILIVDDNSPDGTIDAVFDAQSGLKPEITSRIRAITQPKRFGKGAAVRRGFEEATGDIVMFMDADHATRVENLTPAIEQIQQRGFESVVAVRIVPNGEPMKRRVISLGLLLLTHMIAFKKPVMDSQCGFKVFTNRAAKGLARYCRIDTGLIDVEIFTLLQKWDVPYGYVTVDWNNDDDSRIEIFKTVMRDFNSLRQIWWGHRSGRYDRPMAVGERCWEQNGADIGGVVQTKPNSALN